jgi:alpha-beta hydrolase superfamily lysophospholipase
MNVGPFENARGERIAFAFHPAARDTKDIVVIGHGVTGSMDRPYHVALAAALAAAGVAALRIAWSGNGESGGRFADSTISKEVADLGSVIDALPDWRVTYVGHSMGAAVGVLRASEDRRIRRLVSLAGMVHVRAFAEHHFGGLTPGHDLMWDKPGMVLSPAYMADLRQIGSTAPHAERVSVPWLLVHGTNDTVVPLQDTHDAFARAPGPKDLVTLEGADHVWEPGFIPQMVQTVVDWCGRTPA